MRPQVADASGAGEVPFYPSFAIACGAFGDGAGEPASGVPIALAAIHGRVDPVRQFVAVARGDSMAGGVDPIRHGDPLLFEWARGVGRADLEGERVLVQLTPGDRSSAVLKELRHETGGWSLCHT